MPSRSKTSSAKKPQAPKKPQAKSSEVTNRLRLIAAVVRQVAPRRRGVLYLPDALVAFGSMAGPIPEKNEAATFRLICERLGYEVGELQTVGSEANGFTWALTLRAPFGGTVLGANGDAIEVLEPLLEHAWRITHPDEPTDADLY